MSSEKVQPNTFNFWRNFTVDFAVAVAFAWFGVTRYRGTGLEAAALVAAGFIAWQPLEYLFHRWLMHGRVPIIRKAHAMHHGHPQFTRSTIWFAHAAIGVPLWALLAWLTSPAAGALLTTGLYAGYTWFRVVHRLVHYHSETMSGRRFFGDRVRLHELHHAQPDRHFGVTSSICDRLFGTFRTS